LRYLTTAQVLFVHARLILETGGAAGLRDLGLLQSALERPKATFGGVQLYPSLHAKAAALLHSIVLNHPMVDGNKRLGIAVAVLFLRSNGVRFRVENEEMERFVLQIAMGGVNVEAIEAWLKDASDNR